MGNRRQARVADLIRDEVSQIIQQEMSDPRLGMASVTRVEMSSDLEHARIFVSVLGDDDVQASSLVVLNNAIGFIRSTLAPRLQMRMVPDLNFRLDRSMAHAEDVARILRELEPELRQADAEASDDKPKEENAG